MLAEPNRCCNLLELYTCGAESHSVTFAFKDCITWIEKQCMDIESLSRRRLQFALMLAETTWLGHL